jgi:Kef-type K+ transport system membrane component KefB
MTATAAAVAVQKHELLLFFTLLELSIIVLAGRVGGWAARRVRQSAAVGEIVIGIALGPSLFGWIAPGAFAYVFRTAPAEPLQILSSLGLVLLMFQIGLEFEFRHLTERANRTAVLAVAITCQLAPFALGLIVGFIAAPWLAPAANRLHCALFIATAFSITALPTLGRMMIELGITRTRLAVIAISAAAINDVVGWLLLALITAITAGEFHGAGYGLRVALVAGYALICIFVVRPLVKRMVRRSNPCDGTLSSDLVGGLLVLVFVSAIATYQLGIFAIFGGFMMGVILFDESELVTAWRASIGQFVSVFFLPIFFTYTGLRTSIGSLASLQDWEWCALILVLATLGKLGGAYVAARLAGRSHPEAATLGYMMNTRALMELVVVNVGFDLGVISPKIFTMLVIMAIVSTVITIPALRRYLPRAGIALPA